ncbi:MAG: sigma-54-dependent transcriptional regulator [Saprospiraceae bacterium]
MQVKNYKILIVDDDDDFRRQVGFGLRAIEPMHYIIETAADEPALWQHLNAKDADYDLILLDLALDKDRPDDVSVGLNLILPICQKRPDIPIVVITNRPEPKSVVTAMQRGAKDFLPKNEWDNELWDKKLGAIIKAQNLQEENADIKQEIKEIKARTEYENPPGFPLLGVSPQMESLRRMLKMLAEEPDVTVLITGETGVGKNVAARFLHHNSTARRKAPFEEIHITHYTDEVLASQLFGAMKGSYTDAKTDIKGRLHLADMGVAFLDEIGDLGERSQAMLLQFLQSKTIRPLGGSKDIQLDVQIVAATNKDIRREIAEGRFRSDLYQRLKMQPIEIAPLRERREDIWVLLLHFFGMGEPDLRKLLEPAAARILTEEYNWEGNVRELYNAVGRMKREQRMRGLSAITPECLPEEILNPIAPNISTTRSATAAPADRKMSMDEENARNTLAHYERALKENNGRKAATAESLGTTGDLILHYLKQFKKKHPGILKDYPLILKHYKTVRD